MPLHAKRGESFLRGYLPNSAVPVARHPGDAATTDTDIFSRMCGALSLDGDISSWTPTLTRRVAELIAIYKDFRLLLVQDFYPLSPQPAQPQDGEVVEFISRDRSDAVVLAFNGVAGGAAVTVAPQGLDPDAAYRVSQPLTGAKSTLPGSALMNVGIECCVGDRAAILWLRRT